MLIRRYANIAGVLVALLAVSNGPLKGAHPQGHHEDHANLRASLRTFEGRVVGLSYIVAEGDLPVLAVELDTAAPGEDTAEVLLAPERVLEAINFLVREGDHLRVHVFVAAQGPVKAHKVINMTRDASVRLRTLHKYPLWDAQGRWQGGPCRLRHGQHSRGAGGGDGSI
jgi:hypothetical protein